MKDIDYNTYIQFKILDAIEYVLDHYSELDDSVFDKLRGEVGNSYEPRNGLNILRNILWAELAK